MNEFYVYAYFEPGSEEPFYIGKGKGDRAWKHLCQSKLEMKTHFYNKLRKMLAGGIQPIIKLIYRDLTEDGAFTLESRLIAQYGRLDLGTGCLCNHTDGGEGQSGAVVSEETRNKIGAGNIGNEITIQHRVKISESKRIMMKAKGTGEKIGATLTKRVGTPVARFDLVTGQILKSYPSQASVRADGFSQGTVGMVCRGIREDYCGYGWKFI